MDSEQLSTRFVGIQQKSLGIIRGLVGSWVSTLLSCQPYTGRPTYKGAAGLINREYHLLQIYEKWEISRPYAKK